VSWMERAACRGMDASIFYVEVGRSAAEARAVCARCPVVDRCAVHAVSSREQFGVWGGLSPRDRGIHGYRAAEPKTHCPHDHLYDDLNTYWDQAGHRRCRKCNAEQKRMKAAG
jgi:WhiB family redox-sensing transcriptional regulator